MRNRLSILWAILCVILGGIAAIEKSLFGVTGETLTAGVRKDLIRAVIYKQLNWFDDERRAPGVLSSYFSEDVACLNGLSTETMSTLVCVALYFCWQQALLTICCSPIILIGVIAMSRLNFGNKRGKQ
jgi:ABC-type multidrug transport system fused ATPase/permease subunit